MTVRVMTLMTLRMPEGRRGGPTIRKMILMPPCGQQDNWAAAGNRASASPIRLPLPSAVLRADVRSKGRYPPQQKR